MRKISLQTVTEKVKESVIYINYNLDQSLVSMIQKARQKETKDLSKSIKTKSKSSICAYCDIDHD